MVARERMESVSTPPADPALRQTADRKGMPMWMVTDRGFFSIVDKGDREDQLCV